MPYVSEAQRRYFHANKAKLEAQGVNVSEWDESTKGRQLPEKVNVLSKARKKQSSKFSKPGNT